MSVCIQGKLTFGVQASLTARCVQSADNPQCPWELPSHSYNFIDPATNASTGHEYPTPPNFAEHAKVYFELAAQAKPGLDFGVDMSAAVHIPGVQGGVSGHVSLIKIELPLTRSFVAALNTTDVANENGEHLSADELRLSHGLSWVLTVDTMVGSVSAFVNTWNVDLCFCFPSSCYRWN